MSKTIEKNEDEGLVRSLPPRNSGKSFAERVLNFKESICKPGSVLSLQKETIISLGPVLLPASSDLPIPPSRFWRELNWAVDREIYLVLHSVGFT